MALDQKQIVEIRQIVRLECLRSAVVSVASESLDDKVQGFKVSCDCFGETLSADITWLGAGGVEIGGGRYE